MLEVTDNFAALLLESENIITCDICGKEAVIFQVEGNYCVDCWQEITEPVI
jgi:hypothetical protein